MNEKQNLCIRLIKFASVFDPFSWEHTHNTDRPTQLYGKMRRDIKIRLGGYATDRIMPSLKQ